MALSGENPTHRKYREVRADHGGHAELLVVLREVEASSGEAKAADHEQVGGTSKDTVLQAAFLLSPVANHTAGKDQDHTKRVPLGCQLLSEVVAVEVAVGVAFARGARKAEEGHAEGLEASLDPKDTNALGLGEGEDRPTGNGAGHLTSETGKELHEPK